MIFDILYFNGDKSGTLEIKEQKSTEISKYEDCTSFYHIEFKSCDAYISKVYVGY